MTFAIWDQRLAQRYEEPRLDQLRSKYDKVSDDKKVLLSKPRYLNWGSYDLLIISPDWMLEIATNYGIVNPRMIQCREQITRRAFETRHETRRHATSLFRRL